MSATNYISTPAVAVHKSTTTSSSASTISFSHRVVYSGISGAIATTCIYPMDLMKTKLQSALVGDGMGNFRSPSPFSIARDLVRAFGLKGLYKGWPPNVLLVMPEKAIKLTANDMFRERIRNMRSKNDLPLYCEMIAGGSAGLCQVVMTNPMELLKIQGATMDDKIKAGQLKAKIPYSTLVRQLGVSGMYTGVAATLFRDIPFSMIYFPMYAQCKAAFAGEGNQANFSFLQSLASGAVAGTVAAASTCPMDVIKTRVHENAKPMKLPIGEFVSRELANIPQQYHSIVKSEGISALFRGIGPRCAIITPLFAITMGFYDLFQSRLG